MGPNLVRTGILLVRTDILTRRNLDKDPEGRACEETGEESHLQARERSLQKPVLLRRNQSCSDLDLGLPVSRK